MRLSLIVEGPGATLKPLLGKPRFQELKQSLSFMPAKKVKHSLRVGDTAAAAGLHNHGVEAAILHDYIERGGDLSVLDRLGLHPQAMRVIQILSIDEKTPGLDDTADVQHHVEQALNNPNIDQHDKDVAIIVKCSDRIDNLKKRIKKGKLSPKYKAASIKLFNTLISSYRGNPKHIRHIKAKIDKLGLDGM